MTGSMGAVPQPDLESRGIPGARLAVHAFNTPIALAPEEPVAGVRTHTWGARSHV